MSKFRVGDSVMFNRDYKIGRNNLDGEWKVRQVGVGGPYSPLIELWQEGRWDTYQAFAEDLHLVEPVPNVSEWTQPLRLQRRPVVNRASSGLRKQLPEYAPGSAGEAFNDIHKAIQRQIQKLMFDAYIPQRYWI